MKPNQNFRIHAGKNRGALSRFGFSLVEVCMALGVFSFGMVGIVGLLPVGLQSNKQAQEQARAIQAMNMVTASILSSGTNGVPAAPFQDLALGVSGTSFGYQENGAVCDSGSNPFNRRATIYVSATMAGANGVGQAYVTVAWPGSATFNSSSGWSKHQGYVETCLYYKLPN